MQLLPEFIKKIEIEYLRILAKLLREGKMNRSQAKDSAKAYLAMLPFSSSEELLTKVKSFVKAFPMIDSYEIYIMHEIEQIKTDQVLEKMRMHMKNDNIEEAINLIDKK